MPALARVAAAGDVFALPDLLVTPWRRIMLSERLDVWCLVDAVHYDWLSTFNWNIWHDGRSDWRLYAKRNIGTARDTVRMHREIKLRTDPDGWFEGAVVDHINGCTLDNRDANLRWATEAENRANSRARGLTPTVEAVLYGLLEAAPVSFEAPIPF